MKLEVLKNDHLKRNIIIGVITVLIVSAIILNFTRAKYRTTQSIPLVNGTINYSLADMNLVGIYIQNDSGYTKTDVIPESGYIFNEKESYCTTNGEKDSSINLTYDNSTKTLSVIPFTMKGTKCYLYFDKTLNGAILADNPTIDDSRSGAIIGPLTENTTGTLFTTEDDYGTSYFYAGDVDNNWVSFAGYYWRIIRINGDGSIRLIYSGDSESGPAETGTSTQIGTSAFNDQTNDNAYVGYMYGTPGSDTYEETHANINDSTIKTVLDNWYQQNLLSYSNYISTEAGFCNDRQTQSGVHSAYGTLGYGINSTTYASWGRLYQNGKWLSIQNPSLECAQSNDYFTVDTSRAGNFVLGNPIGLITSDEIILAGGFGGENNVSYYLYTNHWYWTMSPSSFGTNNEAHMLTMNLSGSIYNPNTDNVNNIYGIRPVINLDKNVTISSGDGTTNSPYIIMT